MRVMLCHSLEEDSGQGDHCKQCKVVQPWLVLVENNCHNGSVSQNIVEVRGGDVVEMLRVVISFHLYDNRVRFSRCRGWWRGVGEGGVRSGLWLC